MRNGIGSSVTVSTRSPTAHVPSTSEQRAFRADPSFSQPQPNEAITATTVSSRRMFSASACVKPTAKTANALMTTIAVLTGSV